MTLGNRIGQYRRKLGMTQEALAQRLDVTNQAVSKWESDACCPDIALLPRIADIFGITMDELFGRAAPISEPQLEPEQPQQPEEEPEQPITEDPFGQPERKPSLFEQLFETTVERVNHQFKKAEQKFREKADYSFSDAKEVPIPQDVELDWEDDGTLRVALFVGKKLIAGHPARSRIEFRYEGPALNIHSEVNVSCDNVRGNVQAGGDVTCDSVGGPVTAGGDVTCGNVSGNVDAGGDATCDSVSGSVDAGGDVNCDDVSGDVKAGGDVNCQEIQGHVNASGDVSCDDIQGNVRAGGDVTCDHLEGSITAGGSVSVG